MVWWWLQYPGAAQPSHLLPTAAAAQQIRGLHAKLRSSTLASPDRDSAFRQLEDRVSAFITTQLDAEPKLTPDQLHDQIMLVLGASPRDSEHAVLVQRWPPSWGPRETGPVVWGVVYGDQHHDGWLGTRIMVESYVVSQGKAALAGRGGSEVDGINLVAYPMVNFKLVVCVTQIEH